MAAHPARASRRRWLYQPYLIPVSVQRQNWDSVPAFELKGNVHTIWAAAKRPHAFAYPGSISVAFHANEPAGTGLYAY